MITSVTLSLAAATLALLAIVMALILGWANKAFHVDVNPKVEEINDALPGANCGGCGYVGCMEYAEAVARGDAEVTLCGPGGASCASQLGEIMGIEISDTLPYRAVVHCAANEHQRLGRQEYYGERTCEAANLVAGVQGCTYGCLGFGDCARACPYDAIDMVEGLAVINYNRCVGCKKCAIVCPRNIITMVPFKADKILVVACSNSDFGGDVKEVCTVGCIGCKACLKNAGDLLKMEDNTPVVDYSKYDPSFDFSQILDRCRMESLVFVGKPTEEDLAGVAHEELPERVRDNFETTVDKTEWRG